MRRLVLALFFVVMGCGGHEPAPATPSDPTTGPSDPAAADDACTTDADCVPAGCCHPSSCVAQSAAPSCGDMVCTTDCRFGTLDCGGSCFCNDGHCDAHLSQSPMGEQVQ